MRRQPRQARSRSTVDAVVEAGVQVLVAGGWASFTTNTVAERAGVSIGTVYQYFPNKQALIEAIRRRHFGEVLAAVAGASDPEKSVAERVDALVANLLHVHGEGPAILHALLEDAPRPLRTREVEAFERDYVAAFMALLRSSPRAKTTRDLETSARMLAAAVEGAIHDAGRREHLHVASFRRELAALLMGYLYR